MKFKATRPSILYCGYRDWAINIHSYLRSHIHPHEGSALYKITLVKDQNEFLKIKNFKEFDAILFIGWSWIVPDHVVNNNKCICLHPSKLPKYRGGSPLQNQIIDGVEDSAVTLFIMDKQLDHGPILYQEDLSLKGNLTDIFERIEKIGFKGITKILDNWGKIIPRKQKHKQATIYKRRKPQQSQILVSDFNFFTAKELYNKIRSLGDPYPNAYIKCKDGTKLYLKESDYEKER